MNGFDWLREHLQSFFYIPVLGFAPPAPQFLGVHTSPDQLQNPESSPPSPPILGGEQLKVPQAWGI